MPELRKLKLQLLDPNGTNFLQSTEDRNSVPAEEKHIDTAILLDTKPFLHPVYLAKIFSEEAGIVSPSDPTFCQFLDGYIDSGISYIPVKFHDNFDPNIKNKAIGHIFKAESLHITCFLPNSSSISVKNVSNASRHHSEQSFHQQSYQQRTRMLEEHAHELIKDLSPEEQEIVRGWLRDFDQTFAIPNDDLGYTDLLPLKINLLKDEVIYKKQYRLPLKLQPEIERQILDLLDKGLIRKSTSPFNSPILAVPKKDGQGGKTDIRVVIDYRLLNNITEKDRYPLPSIEFTLMKLSNQMYFSTLDLLSGFWQMAIAEDSIKCTAFSTPLGHYEWNVVPFGLTNAPPAFQRLMNCILTPEEDPSTLIYIDDVISMAKNLKQADEAMRRILSKLEKHNLKIKLAKCKFLQQELEYLGHIVSLQGIKPDERKVQAIRDARKPTNRKEVRRFLGTTGFYCKFIANYAKIARPLQKLTANVKFEWTAEHDKAWSDLKDSLKSETILIYPDPNKPYYITTDASDIAVGGVLAQMIDERELPIYYLSRALKEPETKYSAYERELLAIVYCLERFRPYVYGQKIHLKTDHRPLEWLLTSADAVKRQRLSRWIMTLMDFNIEVKYLPGRSNKVADWLSRDIQNKYTEAQMNIDLPDPTNPFITCKSIMRGISVVSCTIPDGCLKLTRENYIKYQSLDPNVLKIKESKQKSEKFCTLDTNVKLNLDDLNFQDELLYYTDGKGNNRLYVPSELRYSVTKKFHNGRGRIHNGKIEMLNTMSKMFYWPGMNDAVREFVSTCHICLANKIGRLPPVPQQHVDRGESPWELLHLDLVGPLRKTDRDHRYILSVVDSFSKFTLLFSLVHKSVRETYTILAQILIPIWGVPRKIITDSGLEFKNSAFKDYCSSWSIIHATSAAYHPSFNGKVERMNALIGTALRALLQENDVQWDELLGDVTCALNNRISRVTGVTPFVAMFGREPRIPMDMYVPPEVENPPIIEPADYCFHRSNSNKERNAMINKYLNAAENQVPKDKDKDILLRKDVSLAPGDFIYLKIPRQGNHKLSLKFPGPYEIIRKVGLYSYAVKNLIDGHEVIIHQSRITRSAPYVDTQASKISNQLNEIEFDKEHPFQEEGTKNKTTNLESKRRRKDIDYKKLHEGKLT